MIAAVSFKHTDISVTTFGKVGHTRTKPIQGSNASNRIGHTTMGNRTKVFALSVLKMAKTSGAKNIQTANLEQLD